LPGGGLRSGGRALSMDFSDIDVVPGKVCAAARLCEQSVPHTRRLRTGV
jgi:hypothetical protein